MDKEKKSPLTDKPLRNPGQSLRDQRVDIVFEKCLAPVLMVIFIIVLTALEWWRFLFPVKPHAPLALTSLALVVCTYAIWQWLKYWPIVMILKGAEEGEKAVGQFLERLRESGHQVFHDIVGDGFNIDHLVIGQTGVYTIETKTWKKPHRGAAEILFDGNSITANGMTPERDPIIQAKAQANWIRQLLNESTGKRFPVRPVVVFPGWFVKSDRASRKEVWVLEPKALPPFIEREESLVSPEDVRLAAYHLSRFIRQNERIAAAR